MRVARCGSALAWVLVVSSHAVAQDELPVVLDVHECVSDRVEVLARIVSIELRASINEAEATPVVEVAARCEEHVLVLTVVDRITQKRVERRLEDPRARPRGWERMVALALAELVMASWAELALDAQQADQSESLVPLGPSAEEGSAPATRDPDRDHGAITAARARVLGRQAPTRRVSLELHVTSALFSGDASPLFGGVARLRWRPESGVGLAVDVGTVAGLARSSELGQTSVFAPLARLALAYTARAGDTLLRTEIGVLCMLMRAEGAPVSDAQGALVHGAVVAPFVRFGMGARVGPRAVVGLELEVGGALVGATARADDDTVVSLSGAYGAVSVSGGVLL